MNINCFRYSYAFSFYFQVLSLYLSTYITVAISLDRCVAILDPMRRNGAAFRVRIMICFAWIFSALFSIPQVMSFSYLFLFCFENFYFFHMAQVMSAFFCDNVLRRNAAWKLNKHLFCCSTETTFCLLLSYFLCYCFILFVTVLF